MNQANKTNSNLNLYRVRFSFKTTWSTARFFTYWMFNYMGFPIHGFPIAFLRFGGAVKLYFSIPAELAKSDNDLAKISPKSTQHLAKI